MEKDLDGNYIDRRLLNASELAALLGVSRQHIYGLMARGLPSLSLGRARRFRVGDVERWIDEQQNAA